MHSEVEVQENIKQSKTNDVFLFLTWPVLMSLAAGWMLYTNRAGYTERKRRPGLP